LPPVVEPSHHQQNDPGLGDAGPEGDEPAARSCRSPAAHIREPSRLPPRHQVGVRRAVDLLAGARESRYLPFAFRPQEHGPPSPAFGVLRPRLTAIPARPKSSGPAPNTSRYAGKRTRSASRSQQRTKSRVAFSSSMRDMKCFVRENRIHARFAARQTARKKPRQKSGNLT
jgi:hypothetical protein